MAAEMRKQLEALMGAEALGGVIQQLSYTDPKVCKDYLCGLCPHTLFTQHSERLKTEYEEAVRNDPSKSLEYEHYRSLTNFIADCDRKISLAQRRLEKNVGDDGKLTRLTEEIAKIENEIGGKLTEIEILGEKGNVFDAIEMSLETDRLKIEKVVKQREFKTVVETPNQQSKLRVCEVCSAYLSAFDSNARLADHFVGKMHMGYVKLRDVLAQLKAKYGPVHDNYGDRRDSGRNDGRPRHYNDRGGRGGGGYDRGRGRYQGDRYDRDRGYGRGRRGDYDRRR